MAWHNNPDRDIAQFVPDTALEMRPRGLDLDVVDRLDVSREVTFHFVTQTHYGLSAGTSMNPLPAGNDCSRAPLDGQNVENAARLAHRHGRVLHLMLPCR